MNKRYPKLHMTRSSPGQNYLHSRLRDKVGEIRPHLHNMDRRFITLKERLAVKLTESYPTKPVGDGSSDGNSVVGNFFQILNLTGFPMLTTNYPPMSNDGLRAESKLASTWETQRHKDIASAIIKAFCQSAPCGLRLQRSRTTGPPLSINDADDRLMYYRYVLGRIEEILQAIRNRKSGGLEFLYHELGLTMTYLLVKRFQPDKITVEGGKYHPKDRFVNTPAYALSGGRRGKRVIASKAIKFEGELLHNAFRFFVRTAYGGNGAMNFVLSTLCKPMHEHVQKAFAFTYHSTGPDDLTSRSEGFQHTIGLDIKQFDQNIMKFFIDLLAEHFDEIFVDGVGDFFRLALTGPYLANQMGQGLPTGWSADPFSLNDEGYFDSWYGNPSGNAFVSFINKLVASWAVLCAIDDVKHNVLEFGVEKILKGEWDVAFFNAGDDTVILSNDESLTNKLKGLESDPLSFSRYFIFEPEPIVRFLGYVFTSLGNQRRFLPSANSMVVNFLAPEQLWRDNSDGLYEDVALKDRKLNFLTCPIFGPLQIELERFYYEATGQRYEDVINNLSIYNGERRKRINRSMSMDNLTSTDTIVLYKPETLHYRFRESDVSKFVLDSIGVSVPEDELMYHHNKLRR